MALQYSVTLRTNRSAQFQTTVGASGTLVIYSGAEPANCAASNPSGTLATINLPATFLASAAGAASLVGTWTVSGAGASGTAFSFRIFDGSSNCHLQGNCTTDMVLSSNNIVSGSPVTITGFTITDGNA